MISVFLYIRKVGIAMKAHGGVYPHNPTFSLAKGESIISYNKVVYKFKVLDNHNTYIRDYPYTSSSSLHRNIIQVNSLARATLAIYTYYYYYKILSHILYISIVYTR